MINLNHNTKMPVNDYIDLEADEVAETMPLKPLSE